MIPPGPTDPLQQLEERLGHSFADRSLMVRALIHRSYAHEQRRAGLADNQTLEFLGDAVLDMVVAEILLEFHPTADEGELTRRRARLVNARSLANRSRELGLDDQIHLGRGETQSGGREKPSILGDALEAVLGALYLDGGLEPVRRLVRVWLEETREESPEPDAAPDAKGRLQQLAQSRGLGLPRYQEEARSGPQHAPCFEVSVWLGDRRLARGEGRSKKAAEVIAAEVAGELLQGEEV